MSYEGLSGEQFVDYLIDEAGLREFVDVQYDGWPIENWDWNDIAVRIAYLSDKTWQPTGAYVETLYWMQCERAGGQLTSPVLDADPTPHAA